MIDGMNLIGVISKLKFMFIEKFIFFQKAIVHKIVSKSILFSDE